MVVLVCYWIVTKNMWPRNIDCYYRLRGRRFIRRNEKSERNIRWWKLNVEDAIEDVLCKLPGYVTYIEEVVEHSMEEWRQSVRQTGEGSCTRSSGKMKYGKDAGRWNTHTAKEVNDKKRKK